MVLRGLLLAITCLAVPDCVPSSANTAAQPNIAARGDGAPAADSWHVTFRLSGGLAGFDRELDLASTGELMATDRRRNVKTTTRASSDELAQIASLAAQAPSVAPSRDSGCRDCLVYDIHLQFNGRTIVIHGDDLSLAGTGLEALVKALSTLLNRTLTQ